MCYVDPRDLIDVKLAIGKLVKNRRRFTGYDVYRTSAINHVTYNAAGISARVRELFNAHDACFQGYACYPVVGGPLLYFYAGAEVLRRGQAILDAIASTAPSTL